MDKLKDTWNDFLIEAVSPKEAAEYIFDDNASLTVDIGIDLLDGKHLGRDKIEDLLKMFMANDELQLSGTKIEKIHKHPDGINIVGLDLGPKLIDANLTLNNEGRISLGRILTSGNQISNCYFDLVRLNGTQLKFVRINIIFMIIADSDQ